MPRPILILAWWCLLAGAPDLAAQSPAPSASPPTGWRASAGIEIRRDSSSYRFENPSSFDTATLVPHFFEQRYESARPWVVLSVEYPALWRRWQTDLSVARWGLGVGHDYDTFFQPTGDTVVYGTTADTEVQSFRLVQRTELGGAWGLRGRLSYVYRRDRSWFRPSDSITRHSVPPSETRVFNAGREITVAAVHEFRLGFVWTKAGLASTTVTLAMDGTPFALTRLVTQLPDKYGDRRIAAVARAFGWASSASIVSGNGPVRLHLSVDYSRASPYSGTDRYSARGLAATASLGLVH